MFGHLLCEEVEEVILNVLLELVCIRDVDLFIVSLVVHDDMFSVIVFAQFFYLNLKLLPQSQS